MKLANRLRKLRLEKKLTLREMAEAVGVPISTYRDWEYGKAIQGEPYEKIAEIFKVSLEELLASKVRQKSDLLPSLLEAQRNIELAIKIAQAL